MIKNLSILVCLLLTSWSSQAALISHYGYERETSSNIVKGGGLDWMMWDVTRDKNANRALSEHPGWRLATTAEMVSLFTAFQFKNTAWGQGNPSHWEWARLPWSANENSQYSQFIALFGDTNAGTSSAMQCGLVTSYCYEAVDLSRSASAWFDRGMGTYAYGFVNDDNTFRVGKQISRNEHYAGFSGSQYYTYGDEAVGSALVRTSISQKISTPASLGLITIGLVVLSMRRRKALYRSVLTYATATK